MRLLLQLKDLLAAVAGLVHYVLFDRFGTFRLGFRLFFKLATRLGPLYLWYHAIQM